MTILQELNRSVRSVQRAQLLLEAEYMSPAQLETAWDDVAAAVAGLMDIRRWLLDRKEREDA